MRIAVTHKNTDFDALASVIAATLIYPGTVPVLPRDLNPNVRAFISLHKDFFDVRSPDQISLNSVQGLVVVDTSSWRRLDGVQSLKDRDDLEIFLWDHHVPAGDIRPTWSRCEQTGATITLMIRAIKAGRIEISPIQATLFLMGIYEDTGSLTFPLTRPEDAYAAGYLLENRADLSVLEKFLRPAYAPEQKDVLFHMIKTASRLQLNGHTVCISRVDIEGHVEGLAVVVRMYREIVNTDAAFGIFTRKDKNRTMVIGRSGVDGIDVGGIMQRLGGGGHPGAGSALLKSVNPEVVEEMVVELLHGNRQASVRVVDLMSFPVTSVSPGTPMKKVSQLLEDQGYSGVPVIDGRDRLVGIISRRDFRKIRTDSQMQAPVKAFMRSNVKTIESAKSPLQAARLMIRHDIGRLPVMDKGRVIGIVSRADIMRYFYDLLPE